MYDKIDNGSASFMGKIIFEEDIQAKIDMGVYKLATFAGGCFWCMIPPYDGVTGVIASKTGYSGGHFAHPDYDRVSTGKTGHYEAIQVVYDPSAVSYMQLLDIFWQQVDPTDTGGQFADRGSQYGTAIFYHNQDQKKAAEQSKEELGKSGHFQKPIVTRIIPAVDFYPAEEYHQDYYKKHPDHYNYYKEGSGRAHFIRKTWKKAKTADSVGMPDKESRNASTEGDGNTSAKEDGNTSTEVRRNASTEVGGNISTSEDENVLFIESGNASMIGIKKNWAKEKPRKEDLVKKLTPLQYKVTQEAATEPAFHNEYWENKTPGLYVDIVTGESLFSSLDKFDSGCGWPSFTKPLKTDLVDEVADISHFMVRTEVRGKNSGSHLGHVFDDGPAPGGLRYCINSTALRFIPVEDLEKEGYGESKKILFAHNLRP